MDATAVTKLHERIEIRAESRLAASEVFSRIREALEARQAIEVDPRARSRRRLAGSIDGSRIGLTASDDRLWTRRKSWNIELDAEIESTPNGTVVHGTIDIPDRGALDALVLLFQVAAAIPTVLVVAMSLKNGRIDLGLVALAVAFAVGGWFVTYRMKRDGEIAAAEDARLLDRALRRLIA